MSLLVVVIHRLHHSERDYFFRRKYIERKLFVASYVDYSDIVLLINQLIYLFIS